MFLSIYTSKSRTPGLLKDSVEVPRTPRSRVLNHLPKPGNFSSLLHNGVLTRLVRAELHPGRDLVLSLMLAVDLTSGCQNTHSPLTRDALGRVGSEATLRT